MEKKDFRKLPSSELCVMQGIWEMTKKGEKNVHANALIRCYPETIGKFKLTTVLTLAMRLAEKGYVTVEKHGRSNCYIPVIEEEEYKKLATADFVATVCRNQPTALLTALCGSGILSEKDIDELKSMLD